MKDKNNKYQKYLLSDEWAKVRVDLILVRGEKCEYCGNPGTQVHHLTYKNIFFEEPMDLVLLCSQCHLAEHGLLLKKETIKKKTLPFLRKALMKKFGIKIQKCRGWIGLARKTAELHGDRWCGSAHAKAYVRRKLT